MKQLKSNQEWNDLIRYIEFVLNDKKQNIINLNTHGLNADLIGIQFSEAKGFVSGIEFIKQCLETIAE